MQWNFGDILLTTLAIFVWAALIWMFILVFGDIFRRRDLSGVAKAGWVFLIVDPAIRRLPHLPDRATAVGAASGDPADRWCSARTSPTRDSTPPTEIEKAGKLQAAGTITPEEFASDPGAGACSCRGRVRPGSILHACGRRRSTPAIAAPG